MRKIGGVIFDLDGVVINSPLDFPKIKKRIGLNSNEPLLESIEKIEDPAKKNEAHQILKEEERKAAYLSNLNEDIPFLFDFLERKGIKRALVTRNNRKVVRMVLEKFGLKFDVVITREDALPKPSEEPIILAYKGLKLSPEEVFLIGDYEFDLIAGKRAGVKTILLKNKNKNKDTSFYQLADVVIDSLKEVKDIILPKKE